MILRLDDYCDFINGGSWSVDEYSASGYPVLKVSNFDKDSISYSDLSYLKAESIKKYERNKLQLHDIVIATVGSHPSLVNSAAGRCLTIPKAAVGLLLNQNAVCLRSKNVEYINQQYLGYLCKSQHFQNFIQQRGRGAANQMRIPISGIKNFEFDFPGIETQRKIATILSAYDDLIENNLKRIKLLEEKAQLTYEEWFVRMKFPGHETAVFDEVTGLPEGWEKGKLSKLFELQRGFDLPVQNRICGAVPVLASTGIIAQHNESKVKGPGIVTGRSGTIGKVQYVTNNFWPLNTTLWVKRFKIGKPAFTLQFLKTIKLERFAGGSAVPSLDRKVVHNQLIRIPEESLILKYEVYCSPILHAIRSFENQNNLLEEARDILLPRLMMGMIDVEKMSESGFTGLDDKQDFVGGEKVSTDGIQNLAADVSVEYKKRSEQPIKK